MFKKILGTSSVLILLILGFVIFTNMVQADWQDPTIAPPEGNIAEPINTGPTEQYKRGKLNVDEIAVGRINVTSCESELPPGCVSVGNGGLTCDGGSETIACNLSVEGFIDSEGMTIINNNYDPYGSNVALTIDSVGGDYDCDDECINYGIYARSLDPNASENIGIYGSAENSSNNIGVMGRVPYGYRGIGVYAEAHDSSSSAISARSNNGVGIVSYSLADTGIQGNSNEGYGVYGYSGDSYGVYGRSYNSYGLRGYSHKSYGLYVTTGGPVVARFYKDGNKSVNFGTAEYIGDFKGDVKIAGNLEVTGECIGCGEGGSGLPDGTTVNNILRWDGSNWVEEDSFQVTSFGTVKSGSIDIDSGNIIVDNPDRPGQPAYALEANSTGNNASGIKGQATGQTVTGVHGIATTNDDGIGVWGQGTSYGVRADGSGAEGIGIYASGQNKAGSFVGDVLITGDLEVTGECIGCGSSGDSGELPAGTAEYQSLRWNGSDWVVDNNVLISSPNKSLSVVNNQDEYNLHIVNTRSIEGTGVYSEASGVGGIGVWSKGKARGVLAEGDTSSTSSIAVHAIGNAGRAGLFSGDVDVDGLLAVENTFNTGQFGSGITSISTGGLSSGGAFWGNNYGTYGLSTEDNCIWQVNAPDPSDPQGTFSTTFEAPTNFSVEETGVCAGAVGASLGNRAVGTYGGTLGDNSIAVMGWGLGNNNWGGGFIGTSAGLWALGGTPSQHGNGVNALSFNGYGVVGGTNSPTYSGLWGWNSAALGGVGLSASASGQDSYGALISGFTGMQVVTVGDKDGQDHTAVGINVIVNNADGYTRPFPFSSEAGINIGVQADALTGVDAISFMTSGYGGIFKGKTVGVQGETYNGSAVKGRVLSGGTGKAGQFTGSVEIDGGTISTNSQPALDVTGGSGLSLDSGYVLFNDGATTATANKIAGTIAAQESGLWAPLATSVQQFTINNSYVRGTWRAIGDSRNTPSSSPPPSIILLTPVYDSAAGEPIAAVDQVGDGWFKITCKNVFRVNFMIINP